MVPRSFWIAIVAFGALLIATTIEGPFTIDENNYLVTAIALQHSRLSVVGTEGLPPTNELLFFDPAGRWRRVESTPVYSVAPPLYAPLALPFVPLGWRGLVLLNTVALLALVVCVFLYLRRASADPSTPWIGAAAVGLGAYFIEYAQGMWPQMLSAALAGIAVLSGCMAIRDSRWWWSAVAGFAGALAAGVRYQNAFLLACLGLGLLLFAQRRVRAAIAFGALAAIPLTISSFINQVRLGSWNPISKGSGYLSLPDSAGGAGAAVSRGFLGDAATMAWARLVDYTAQPQLSGASESFLSPQPHSGAYVLVTAVKKAWLQSSPWMIVPMLLLLLCWMPARQWSRVIGGDRQREMRFLSLVVVPVLGMFAATGLTRTDGFCFNQRYFCELVPLMALVLAWSIDGVGARRTALLAGAGAGTALAFVSLRPHHLEPLRHHLVRYLPLVLALLFLAAWTVRAVARARAGERPSTSPLMAAALGACLAWGLAIHLGDDVKASRILRRSHQASLSKLEPFIADHSAVFASGALKDALGPLLLRRDVVIAVSGLDRAAHTEELLETFLAQGRAVYILPNAIQRELLDLLLAGKIVRGLGNPTMLIEVRSAISTPSEA